MSENDNDEDKTEDPSEHKLEKAKNLGKRIDSKELTFLLFLCINFCIFYIFRINICSNLIIFFKNSFKFDFYLLNKNIFIYYKAVIEENFLFILFFLFVPILTSFLIPFFFGRIRFNINNIKVNFNKLNIFYGIKKIFSSNIFVELFKTLMKIFFISLIFYFFIKKKLFEILNIYSVDDVNINIFYFLYIFIFFSIIGIFSFVPISIIDFFLEYNKYYKNLKMSKNEVLEEFKKIEGNPNIRSIIKKKRKEQINILKNTNISTSNAILIDSSNSFCVAIKYDKNTMHAPKVLRKSTNKEILNIKKIAYSKMIPILENSKLTMELYKYCDSGKYVPERLYFSVAEIINWSQKMKKWMLFGGIKPTFNKKF
ncbi:EscU/YscU/HrcU family type III secretion system export apparatus switch protein [Buchnera aphidicola]|uniref:EscU/YscU/HrcU family type III secretion system export apparatus switch protein n=1 Tax=Buchnera aphidicola TaxID=9 RepID=UPI0031B85412